MMVCIAEVPELLDAGRWRVRGWMYDLIEPGSIVEQQRYVVTGQPAESMLLWATVGEYNDGWVTLEPRGYRHILEPDCQCLQLVETEAKGEVHEDDFFTFFRGALPGNTEVPCPDEYLGLGDVVAAVTKAVGIEPCEGCEERKKRWNKALPKVLKRKPGVE